MRIKNLPSIESMDGSQDALIIEQTDGSEDKSRKVSPSQIKQFIQAGDFEATGEVVDGHGNILNDMSKSADVDDEIGDLSQTGLTGDSVSEQLANVNKVTEISDSGQYGCAYKAYKYGKVVTLCVTGITNASTGQSMNLFTLPEGWRPKEQIRAYGSINMGTLSGSGVIGFNIYSNGRCDTYSYSAMSGGGFTITYIVA